MFGGLVIILITIALLIQSFVTVVKEDRVAILTQIQSRYEYLVTTMEYFAGVMYDRVESTFSDSSEMILETKPLLSNIISESSEMLLQLGMIPQAMILLENGVVISNNTGAATVEQIKKSYWYIQNITSPQMSFWTSIYDLDNSEALMRLCYVKTIVVDGEYRGVIIVSVSSNFMEEIYSSLLSDGSVVYMLDSSGKVISHPKPGQLGLQSYYMPYFWTQFDKNSSVFYKKNTSTVLFSNVYNDLTEFTIVEEKEMSSILRDTDDIILIIICVTVIWIILLIVLSYYMSKKISKPIISITDQLSASDIETINPIDEKYDYREIHTLSIAYNNYIDRIKQLITDIKNYESEKRRKELSFLQAQINPHFLHNTLFSIKCLIDMNKTDEAGSMLSNLVKILKNPINIHNEWIRIEDEISYLRSYVSLMQNRYGRHNIIISISVDNNIKNTLIPRLLLQPIVENSIFHGIGEKHTQLLIHIEFMNIGEKLIVRISDDGKGMSDQELNTIWNKKNNKSKFSNHIGLLNVRERIKLLYGSDCDITMISEKGEGVETILNLLVKEVCQ